MNVKALGEAVRVLRALVPKTETFSVVAAVSTVDKAKKKKAARDQFSRVVVFPHLFRPKQKVVAFVPEGLVGETLAMGAVAAGGRELVSRMAAGEIEFDLCVATPEMALALKADASALKRNMPSVKKGTVSDKVCFLSLFHFFLSFFFLVWHGQGANQLVGCSTTRQANSCRFPWCRRSCPWCSSL